MSSKFILSTLAATIIGFFGGWLIWGIALAGYFEANTVEAAKGLERSEEEFIWWSVLLGQLIWAALITWVLTKTGDTTVAKGAVTGLILTLLMSAGFDFFMYGMLEMYSNLGPVIVDVLANGVLGAVIGAAAGWILGRGQ